MSDKAMRARVEGRLKTAERTAWLLNIGALGIRCLAEGKGYIVEARSDGRWIGLGLIGTDALCLLQAVTSTRVVHEALATRV